MSDPRATHLDDQYWEAVRDTARIYEAIPLLHLLADGEPMTSLQIPVPGGAGLAGRDLRPCRHVRAGPRMVLGLFAEPPYVYCADCFAGAAEIHAARHPDTCDLCGGRSGKFREMVSRVNEVFILVGHGCPDCYRAGTATA